MQIVAQNQVDAKGVYTHPITRYLKTVHRGVTQANHPHTFVVLLLLVQAKLMMHWARRPGQLGLQNLVDSKVCFAFAHGQLRAGTEAAAAVS